MTTVSGVVRRRIYDLGDHNGKVDHWLNMTDEQKLALCKGISYNLGKEEILTAYHQNYPPVLMSAIIYAFHIMEKSFVYNGSLKESRFRINFILEKNENNYEAAFKQIEGLIGLVKEFYGKKQQGFNIIEIFKEKEIQLLGFNFFDLF